MEKTDLLFEGREKITTASIREFSPQGTRLDVSAAGQVSGRVSGLILETHNSLAKPDGTSEAEARSMIFSNGEPVMMWGKVTGKVVDPTPIFQLQMEATFQTPSKRLAFLNTTRGRVEGLVNFGAGEYTFKVYAV